MISRRASAILARLVNRLLPIAALAALALGAGACATPCDELGTRICACQPAGAARDACDRAVKQLVREAKSDEAQQDFCDSKLGSCPDPATDSNACDTMNTPAGKVACGLAYTPPATP